jgi:hypothetical protein
VGWTRRFCGFWYSDLHSRGIRLSAVTLSTSPHACSDSLLRAAWVWDWNFHNHEKKQELPTRRGTTTFGPCGAFGGCALTLVVGEKMKKISILLTVLCLLLGTSACTTTTLSGSIKNKVYTSPSGRYSVPVPVEKYLGAKFQDDPYGISFTDDFCNLFRIEVVPMPKEEIAKVKQYERKMYLENTINGMYLPSTILRVFPSSTVTYQNWYPDLKGGTLYAEVALPGGSIGVESINGAPPKRVDAERGILLFIDGEDLCVVTTSLSQIRKFGETTEDRIKRMRPTLEQNTVDFMKTIEFAN